MATTAELIPQSNELAQIAELLKIVQGVKGSSVNDSQTTTESGGPTTISESYGSGGSISTPGDLGPLKAVLAQQMPLGTMEGMAPILNAIFAEGSKQLPDLYSRAGATGSRVQHNSIVAALQNQLGTDLANKVALLLSQNQQATAKTAEAIAAQGRRTSSSQSQTSKSTTTPGTRTSTTNKTGSSPGVLGSNGLQKLMALIAGGTGLNNAAKLLAPAANYLGGLFSGGNSFPGGDLGSGLSLSNSGLGLKMDAAQGLQPPPDFASNLGNFQSELQAPLAPFPTIGGEGLRLPESFNTPTIETDFSFGGDFGVPTYTPPDFSNFGSSLGDLAGSGSGFQVPTLTPDPVVDAANYTPTDFSSFGADFGGEGLKLPSDLLDWFGGAFADGGEISVARSGGKFNLGVNPVLNRIAAVNYAPRTPTPTVFAPGAAASFGRSNQPTITNSPSRSANGQSVTFDAQGRLVYTTPTTPTIPAISSSVAPTTPIPLDRAAALEAYRKTLANQDLYSNSGNTLSVWKDPTPYNGGVDPETGLLREDPFAGFAQEAKNGMFGTPDVFDARRKQLAQTDLARIKATIPISMSLEQAKKTFAGIENLSPEIQQAIADDPRRFAASMKGLLPITDPKLKDWQSYSREGDGYNYSFGGRLEPTKAGNAAMRWHPEYGLIGPPGAIAPNYEESSGLLTPLVGPALTVGSFFFPVLAPFASVYGGMQAAKNDNPAGFFASMVGLGGAAAGLAGNKGLATAAQIGSGVIKVGDAYFKYQEYQDYLDKVEEYNRKVAAGQTGVAPKTPTPTTPESSNSRSQTEITTESKVTGSNLQQQILQRAGGIPGARATPTVEKTLGDNSILDLANLGGAGSPAYATGAEITLDSLPAFQSLAQNLGGISSAQDSIEAIPKKADGGSIIHDLRMMQIDRIVDGPQKPLPTSSLPLAPSYGGKYTIDEELAKSKGITVKQLEDQRAKKLQEALKKRKISGVNSGLIQGPGTPTSDNLLIAASPSEYVLPSDVVSYLGGSGVLDELLALVHSPS